MEWGDEVEVKFDSTMLFQYPEDMSVYGTAAGKAGNYIVFRIGGSSDIAYYRDSDGLFESGFKSLGAAKDKCEQEDFRTISFYHDVYKKILKRLVECADNGYDTAELHDIVKDAKRNI
jgi:hypothetical protein